ncbi:hypothetical protein [Mangrovicoccus sp. HB161399]|uniref:hypothetical protein n=1 Tax=Mangrovicoccus sp. HB161399 TaxID=2720392 RepID=UPI0020A6D3D7|nr:hypothetical protein [Mangrovicoccus sp. HB161399]
MIRDTSGEICLVEIGLILLSGATCPKHLRNVLYIPVFRSDPLAQPGSRRRIPDNMYD